MMVFAVAIYQLSKPLKRPSSGNCLAMRTILSFAFAAAIAMFFYSGTKALGEYYEYRAERTEKFQTADEYCLSSLRIDPGNAAAYYYCAVRHANENDYNEASRLLSEGIDRGLGVSITYSILAKYQELAGDLPSAEHSLAEAVRIFPRSVFLRARYALFLEEEGKSVPAADQLAAAREIDPAMANGWYEIIKNGSLAAYYRSQADPSVTPPAELVPQSAVQEYLDERMFPRPSRP
jgi:tetratricopeptide (TPR) repeat protein